MTQVFKQTKKILKAWKAVSSGLTSEEAREKAVICNSCEFKKYSSFVALIEDELKDVEGFICGKCKCPLIAKVRAEDEECPLGKWKSITQKQS